MHAFLSLVPANPLAAEWRRLQAADPLLQLGEAARGLDVAEAELVAALCGDGVFRLDPPFGDLVRALPALGRVRALTRGPHAAIETRGGYPPPELGCAGLAGDVGARFRLEQWAYGFACDEAAALDGAPALLFYDGRGEPVHEVHVEPDTDRRAWAKLVDVFASFDQSSGVTIPFASADLLRPRADLSAWLRQADDARPVARDAVTVVLETVRREAIPVSLAVHSAGVVHRFSGLLHGVAVASTRIDVRAPWAHAWIATDRVAEVWLVHRPSLDGPVTALHLLDGRARVVASIGAARCPGTPESEAWARLVGCLAG
jgi:putative hemin transport protein